MRVRIELSHIFESRIQRVDYIINERNYCNNQSLYESIWYFKMIFIMSLIASYIWNWMDICSLPNIKAKEKNSIKAMSEIIFLNIPNKLIICTHQNLYKNWIQKQIRVTFMKLNDNFFYKKALLIYFQVKIMKMMELIE